MLFCNILTSVNKSTMVIVFSNTQSFFLECYVRTPLCARENFSFLGQNKNKKEIGMWMVVGEFLFLKVSCHEMFEILKSRSPLESWDLFSKFLFFFSKLEKNCRSLDFFAKILILFSNQKTGLDISLFLNFTFWHLVNVRFNWIFF